MSGTDTLVLVTYYLGTREEAAGLVEHFAADVGQPPSLVVVVDNSGKIEPGEVLLRGRRFRFVRGSNVAWEFSGWLEGMRTLGGAQATDGVLTLLNDSFRRNWHVSPVSLLLLRRMYRCASRGRVAGWQDNFSWWGRPRFARRPNSRIVVLPLASAGVLGASIERAIEACRARVEEGAPLFSVDERARLEEFFARAGARWPAETLPARLQRIFIEHHLYDAVPGRTLRLFPGTLVGGIVYAALRHLLRERR